MSIDEKKESVIISVSLSEIEKELGDTHDTFLELHDILLSMSYTVRQIADEIEDKHFVEAGVLLGIHSMLKMSAGSAHDRALHVAEFERIKLNVKA